MRDTILFFAALLLSLTAGRSFWVTLGENPFDMSGRTYVEFFQQLDRKIAGPIAVTAMGGTLLAGIAAFAHRRQRVPFLLLAAACALGVVASGLRWSGSAFVDDLGIASLLGVLHGVAVVGLGQAAFGGAVTEVQGVRRVLGTYTSPNHFALLLGRTIPFLLAIAWLVPRWRLWAGAGLLLCGGALLATFSVGGWLGTALAMLVAVGLVGGRRIVLGLTLAGLLAGVVVFAAAPVERLAGRLDPRQGTSFVRVQLWGSAVTLIQESPLLGIGLDNFLYRYPMTIPPDTPYEPNLSHPHNLILQFWLQLGLPGLVALGWLLVRFGQLIWPTALAGDGRALDRAIAVGAVGSMTDFVAHGLVDNSYFLPDMAIVFWLTLAVAACMRARFRSDNLTVRAAT